MESAALYQHLLSLNTPLNVSRVELDMGRRQVNVDVGHASGARFGCPECGKEMTLYEHQGEHTWRHLDSVQLLTYLHAKPPRVSCPDHEVKQARMPWAEPGSRFTHFV